MIFLALETAISHQSVAVFDDLELLGYVECRNQGSLTPQLIPAIHQLLEGISLTSANLEGLTVSLGPGTFTGLRVGLATMTAFRLALGIPLVGVSTLEGLAWNLPDSEMPIVSTVAIRADLVYWGRFNWQKGQLIRLDADQIGKWSMVAASISEPTIALGDGWIKNKEGGEPRNSMIIEGPSEALWPSAKGIGRAGRILLDQGTYLPEGCTPHYIQPSYAQK